MNLVGTPNRYGLPSFFELHVWAFEDNPDGSFADFNIRVSCEEQRGELKTPKPVGREQGALAGGLLARFFFAVVVDAQALGGVGVSLGAAQSCRESAKRPHLPARRFERRFRHISAEDSGDVRPFPHSPGAMRHGTPSQDSVSPLAWP